DLIPDILPFHDIIALQADKIAGDIDRFDKGQVEELLGQGGILGLIDVFVLVIALGQKVVGLQFYDLWIVGGMYGDVIFLHDKSLYKNTNSCDVRQNIIIFLV